jgi:hypothetical protein
MEIYHDPEKGVLSWKKIEKRIMFKYNNNVVTSYLNNRNKEGGKWRV